MKDSTTGTKNYVNRKERIGGLIYVLFFFFIGVGAGSWFLLDQSDMTQIFSRKDLVNAKMKRQQDFRRGQERVNITCDIIAKSIEAYDPGVNAIYEKNDIQFMINELRKEFENNRLDRRYMVFLHMSDFYQMWFNDKQHLWSLESNLAYLKQNLEECELGLEKRREANRTR